MGFPFTPGYSSPNPGSPLRVLSWSRGLFELVRPVNPYTLALSSKSSRPVVSPASCPSVASQASYRRVALRPGLRSLHITQVATVSNRCSLSSRNHRLTIHYCNGRSLSGMDLTRERWCCSGRLLSRLDMNTCQMSIKNDVLLYSCCSPHLESTRQTRDHHIGSERTDQKGESQADKH